VLSGSQSSNTDAFAITPLIKRIAILETRLAVSLIEGPPISPHYDAAQIEQALINLLSNAAEAAVSIRWENIRPI
jgi:two-component system nitrogen regulation sensor histidine kinase NtrY